VGCDDRAVLLLDPLTVRGRTAPSRVLFGPIVTNLGDDERRFTPRHRAFYAARAAGGAGIVVTEEASVHASDWPYERAPLAERCGDGWREIVAACEPHGALVVAGIGHAGGQGSSAYNQAPLLAPSRVPEVNSREVPKWMEADDVAAIVAGFAGATKVALDAGCAGVEVNAGQHSLVRQFLSGLTNHRGDEWGGERLHFGRQVLAAVRAAAGEGIVGLRLSCDELAPWAGITPEMAPSIAAALSEHVDYLVVTRGSIYSAEKTRPDFHEPPGFNIDVCRAVKAALPASIVVVLQGSVVDPGQAEWALTEGVCDAVEMTRAQLADPALVGKLRDGRPEQVRPCIRCNQTCQVRDARNPIISCVCEPSTGFEGGEAEWTEPSARPRDVVVVGGGPAGLETARVAATRGHRVRLVERGERLGGTAAIAGPGLPLVEWQEREVRRLGVEVELGAVFDTAASGDAVVVQCTGSTAGVLPYEVADGATVVDVYDWRAGTTDLPPDGTIVVFDPIGGPIGVAAAEDLGARAVLVTQDQIAGNELSRTGDLAPANVRLQQQGVAIERRSLLRTARRGEVELEDRFSGERRTVACAAVLDCGFRLPDPPLPGARLQAGDCVAPRTILEAILEGRRAAVAIDRA
jgi:2,4-dienoyl-CoA reductase (NADPH2)